MGIRINVLFDHDLADFTDQAATLTRLASTTQAALAVREYWLAADPTSRYDNVQKWQAEPELNRLPKYLGYTGPGSLFLTVTHRVARIYTGGRWRGFISIEPLRRVHLPAFKGIARALGADRMALYADSDHVDDLWRSGGTFADCVELMQQRWGPPQPNVEEINLPIASAAEHSVPMWFLESTE